MSGLVFARFSAAVAVSVVLSGTAGASAIVLSSDYEASPGVVRVDMWFEDPTRNVDLAELQFDIDLNDSGPGSLAAQPNFRSSTTTRTDGTNNLVFPFDLFASVTDPTGAKEVRSIHAAREEFDINGIAALIASYPTCIGEDACDVQDAGLLRNRIYVGSFDMHYDGTPVYYTLPTNSIFGGDSDNSLELDPFLIDLRTGQGPRNRAIEGLAPEPMSLGLIGVALAALGVTRRTSSGACDPHGRERGRPRRLSAMISRMISLDPP